MSGGHFNYDQYKVSQIADQIDDLIFHNGSQERASYGELRYQEYPPSIVEAFKAAANKMREAYVYAQRIDWLVSGDDGEDSFRRRLAMDLKELKPYQLAAALSANHSEQVSVPASAFASRAITHYEAALLAAFPSGSSGEVFNQWNEARHVLAAAPAVPSQGEQVRVVPVEPTEAMRKAAQDKLASEGLIVTDWLIHTAYSAMLYAAPAAPAADAWIPVSERLPGDQGHDSEEVLCFLNGHCSRLDDECRQGGGWGIRLGYYDADIGTFRVFGRPKSHVTHWMPLPAAPIKIEANRHDQ